MAARKKAAKKEAAPVTPAGPIDYGPSELRMVCVKELAPTPDNKRVIHEDSPKFLSLMDSIRAQGVQVPVHARPHRDIAVGGARYDLRAGARRHRAVTLLGLKEIPCIVHTEMSDAAAYELTLLENWEREDLTPFEESETVAGLLELYKGDPAAVAARLGKTDRWVALRARLQHLGKAWREKLDAGEFYRWSAAHLELIARFDEPEQELLLAGIYHRADDASVRELADYIETNMLHQVSKMPWDIDDATLVKKTPACAKCRSRSSCQGLLFALDGDSSDQALLKSDRCLNAACYQRKLDAWLLQRDKEVRAEHPNALRVFSDYPGWQEEQELKKTYGNDCVSVVHYDKCKKTDKGARPALIVHGKQAGKIIHVKPLRPTADDASSEMNEDGEKKPTPLKERCAALEAKRCAEVLKQLRDQVEEVAFDDLEKVHGDDRGVRVGRLVAAIGTIRAETHAGNDEWALYDKFPDNGFGAVRHTWPRVREVLLARLRWNGAITQTPERYTAEAKRVAGFCGLSYDDLYAAACDVYKEPKTWAKLNANGTPKANGKKATENTEGSEKKKPRKIMATKLIRAAYDRDHGIIPDGPSLLIIQTKKEGPFALYIVHPTGDAERLSKRQYPDRSKEEDIVEDLIEYAEANGYELVNPKEE